MSRTVRKSADARKWADDTTPGKIEKLGRHKSCMGHRLTSKLRPGPGGINCPCCTKVPPGKLKVMTRRYERHTASIPDDTN
jgi:hypothetical protein